MHSVPPPQTLHVFRSPRGWEVHADGDKAPLSRHDLQLDAVTLALTYADIFGPKNFFLEIQDHHLEQDGRLTPQLNRLSHETGLPLVATNQNSWRTEL